MKQKLTGKIMIVIGIVFICFALVLYFHNETIARKAETVASEILEEISTTGETVNSANGMVIEAEGKDYAGILEIPSLALTLPVFAEMNEADLAIAPCVYSGSVADNNLVIAGHNYTVQFGKLDRLKPGDLITYTNANQTAYSYTVSGIQVLDDTEVEEMTSSNFPLTLFTCDYSGQERVTIRCDKVTS